MITIEYELNRRVLIVDDNASIHEDFREILCPTTETVKSKELEAALFGSEPGVTPARAAFELDSAFQGQEALEMVKESLVQKRPYALAFVDVRMPPGWDGIETIARIWEVCPDLQVVVCTAYADYSWEEIRHKVGQPDSLLILKKPFDNIEVQQLAHALTKKWSLNRRAEMQLLEIRHSEERFSKAFRENPIPGAIQSFPELKFLDVNDRLAQVTGYSREELIGRSAAELFLWEKPEVADEWYDSLSCRQGVRQQSARIRAQNGELRDMIVSVSLVEMNGRPHALLLAEDVSERMLLERQLRQAQKMEAIGQLAAGVAHDFNNILTVIQGHAELLRQKNPASQKSDPSVEQIAQASVRAANLVRQLLMFSRKQIMQFRNLNLNEVLSNIIKMLERLLGEQVEIVFTPQASLPAISADGSMIEQIAMNLAVNARDAMPHGGKVVIKTCLRQIRRAATPMDPEARDGQYVCLSFTDSGVGMDAQVLSRIFEPFFTTKPAGKGTGLGLSTVFGIVRQHHGWLEVESEPGRGTTFSIFFPSTQKASEKSETVEQPGLVGGNETILVAEDEEALRQMVAQVLSIHGYTVLEAASGPQALEVWHHSNRTIDLLITDMVMPGGMMGNELAETLSARSPTMKVIYTSGYSPGMAGKDSSVVLQRNFLAKPFSIARLTRIVRECLDSKHTPGVNGAAHDLDVPKLDDGSIRSNGCGHALQIDG